MPASKNVLPPCGLYRTSKALPDHEDDIAAGTIVYFHNHSDSGLPVVIAPDHNILNRWHFHGAGFPFRSLAWADSLVRLPPEGFYVLRRPLDFDGGSWPKSTLVQLGYTRTADPILFIGQLRAHVDENDLFFSDRGVAIDLEKLGHLEQVNVYVEPTEPGGHGTGTH
ncbi:MAG TPA: hypothetical protein VGH28_32985 [Polyangiaceae bacterium]|jgi:hypothetical protein